MADSRRGNSPARVKMRCAIYTRKSSEEGLEQEFNSLDAQREACEAYITSQKHEGWTTLPEFYDDGAYSGATMDRPALQRILEDIRARKIDIVVVYKVDRLTRSLADFAKIVEVFDAHGVSFVSVTQAFNTTSSMGRLTLNVLLSFAQFEREVTGERIRDKIAASKKKGMWMGGLPSLGYDVKERKLIVNEAEATTVRHIFGRYLELGSVRALQNDLHAAGIVSKSRIAADGSQYGAQKFSRGALYLMLQNRIYRGEIVHKDKAFAGEHAAIVEGPIATLTIPAQLKRAGMEMKFVVDGASNPEPADTSLIRLFVRAQKIGKRLLQPGNPPLEEIANEENIGASYATRLVRLTFLAPDIVAAILAGKQPADLTANKLMADTRLPLDWRDQRTALGFA